MGDGSGDVLEHYGDADERARLDTPLGRVEFERTVEILVEHLPPPPATVADIGGGPGRYALWLAERGYRVLHRDLVPKHVEQLRADAAAKRLAVETAVGDARRVDISDGGVDAALLLGPLYHLPARRDRLQALRESARVVRPGGLVFAAAISRWAPRLDGQVVERLDIRFPSIAGQIATVERSGRLTALSAGSFSGYCHRPGQLRAEVRAAGLAIVDLVSLEGIAFALGDLEARLDDPRSRAIVMDAARDLGRVPELMGIGPHLLATARREQPG